MAFLQISCFLHLRRRHLFGRAWPGLVVILVRILAGRSQDDAARVRRGFQECGADVLFEVVDLRSEDGLSDAEVCGGLVEVGVPGPGRVRRAGPGHEDYLRAQIARR
jgi:hypothetical protein